MAVSTAFPPACYKSDAFLLNRETIPLQMELIPAKIGMDKHFWHGIGCLERLQCQKNPPLCFHKDGFFHGCFHLFFHISWSSFRAFHFENVVIICVCHWLLGSGAVAVQNFRQKYGMCSSVHLLDNFQGEPCTALFQNRQSIFLVIRNFCELFHFSAGLKPKCSDDAKVCLLWQYTNCQLARFLNDVMGVVLLVDADGKRWRLRGNLHLPWWP